MVLILDHILPYTTKFMQQSLMDFGVCFFSSFVEMALLTAIVFLAALLHQSDGEVGACTCAKTHIVQIPGTAQSGLVISRALQVRVEISGNMLT